MTATAADTIAGGEPLSLDHRGAIESALATLSAAEAGDPAAWIVSELSFANLWLFREAHDYRFIPGAWPGLVGRAYDGLVHRIPLFPLAGVCAEALRAWMGDQRVLYPLSQRQADALSPDHFDITFLRDDADYLYPAQQFRDYAGRALGHKRGLARQFVESNDVTVRRYERSLVHDASQVLASWMRQKGKRAGEADEVACRQALQHAETLGLHGEVHYVDGHGAGFVLADMLRPGLAVMRFAKGVDRYKGIAQHMFSHYAQERPELQWINFEQDLGLANFRRTKLSYRPTAMVPKFRARLR